MKIGAATTLASTLDIGGAATGTTLALSGAATGTSLELTGAASGITLELSGAMTIYDTLTINSYDGLKVASGSITASTGVLTIQGVSSTAAITGTSTVWAAGVSSSAAVTATADVYSSASAVVGGSITASAGVLTVQGVSSTAAITGSSTVWAAGVSSSAAITVTADIYASGNVVAGGTTLTSDARWKTDVESVATNTSLAAILAMRPVTYRWNADAPHTDKASVDLGFLAQQVRDSLPEPLKSAVVKEIDDDGHIGLAYSKITAVLTGALQEQQTIIDDQRKMIEEQQALVDDQQEAISGLVARVEALEVWRAEVVAER